MKIPFQAEILRCLCHRLKQHFQNHFPLSALKHLQNINYHCCKHNMTLILNVEIDLWLAIDQFPHLKSESYCVCNSDNLYSVNALKLIRENDFENAVLAYDRDTLEFPPERVSSFSIMTMNSEMNLLNFIEKPTKDQVDKNLDENGKIRVSMNIFKFSGKSSSNFIINCPINPLRNEKELPSAIMNMITGSDSYMKAVPIAEHVPDLTSKKDIAILEKLIT